MHYRQNRRTMRQKIQRGVVYTPPEPKRAPLTAGDLLRLLRMALIGRFFGG